LTPSGSQGSHAAGELGAQIDVTDLVIRYGAVTAVRGVSFSVGRGEHLTLLGPSGCGKTTTLRSIAGLERPSGGEIIVDGKPFFSEAQRVDVPTEKRGISMVFQSYAIWPHMSVFDNVAYGLNVRRQDKATIADAVRKALDLVQMTPYADRAASRLSGGQQQRVALARAIAFSPKVVLFDEPLSNLDAKLRNEMREELGNLRDRLKITSLYVTHDQEEAFAISDKVVVMNAGRIEQIGTPETIYERPANHFVADFVGSANIVRGKVKGPNAVGSIAFEANGVTVQALSPFQPDGTENEIAIRPAYVALEREKPQDARLNVLAATIVRRMFHGDFIQYRVATPIGDLMVRGSPTNMFEPGSAVLACLKPEHCVLLKN
jgi:ABC-type Fe3+/spermidine/putrescine transport system ATPase subunit